MAKRLREGDPEIIETFTKIYGIPKSTQEKLKDPKSMASYFRDDIKKGMVEIGFSIDWRREFTTIDPLYSRYIEWHFRTLNRKGLITRGTHPVAWCPNDKSPVGVVDTQGDVEPDIGESFLVKFERDGVFYPTSTLRPETVFGVTNLWVNPEGTYVRAKVDEESWIVSRETVERLQHQNHKVAVEREIQAPELLWKTVRNPVAGNELPIFPGSFVEPDNGTGVVMSVPGHAPYDYQALIDLKARNADSAEAGAILQSTNPISIIRVEGFSDLPAKDLIEKFGVKDQNDPHLEQATQELYSKEFHDGVMKENTGGYSGMPVAKAREAIVQELTRRGKIETLLELKNAPVVCRCGTKCLVHILENQWFINYGDSEWKKLAHKCLDQMVILPEEIRAEFNYTLDWLRESIWPTTYYPSTSPGTGLSSRSSKRTRRNYLTLSSTLLYWEKGPLTGLQRRQGFRRESSLGSVLSSSTSIPSTCATRPENSSRTIYPSTYSTIRFSSLRGSGRKASWLTVLS